MAKLGLIKLYDKDLKLYQEFAKTLLDYRLSLLPIISIESFREYKRKDELLLNRLAKRLNVKRLDI